MRLTRASKGPPEDSLLLRIVAAAAVEVAIVAVVAQGAVDTLTAVAAITLAPLGYWFSYRQRHRSAVATKVVLAVALMAAFASFLQQVQGAATVDQARLPLASLFLWVQVLHAFDVPRRRDLAFSAVSSVILMAEAGSLSLDGGFSVFLLPWAALAGVWLFLSGRPQPAATATIVSERRSFVRAPRTAAPARSVGAAGLAVLVAATGVFLMTPRLPGVVVQTPPFSLHGGSSPVDGFQGQVSNPGLPAQRGNGPTDLSPTAYPGFGDSVDLRARGRLSDTVVMRVRSPQASLWRGQVYDTFDGILWTASDEGTLGLDTASEDGSFTVPPQPDGGGYTVPTHRVVQTFYVQTQQPNVVFTAAGPQSVFFPAGGLRVDRYGSIRAPILLDPGLVYSVISQVPVVSTEQLRRSPASTAGLERYLQVPADPPARDGALATRITAGLTTTVDKAEAVQTWLQEHTEYDLDIPPDPQGVDAVDHFLFETRRGFCEHIASAMVLLLREAGVPARFVVGFGPGDRNPLTGYFDVRESDAHAWVEVLYPGVGWIAYDPTFGVPNASPGVASRFIAPEVLRAIARWLSAAVPEPLRRVAAAAVGAIARHLVWLLAAITVALLGLVARRARGRRRERPPPAIGAAAAFATLTEALAATGRARPPQQTPSEFLREVAGDPDLPPALVAEARTVVRAFERERFSAAGVGDAELAAASAAAGRARGLAATAPRAGAPR